MSGKLEDDLVRIGEILHAATPDSILVLNETFSSTTLHDARFLGTKLLTTVMRLDALCVYVTFVDDLAALGGQVVSMMSTIVPENPAERTYKVVEKAGQRPGLRAGHRREIRRYLRTATAKARVMKVHLLHEAEDFDFGASLPAGHKDLIQDLELTTFIQAMAAGDKFLADVSLKVMLACLVDPEAIRYRQRVLADCLAQPIVIREMYDIALGALHDKRHLWGSYGGTYQNPSSNLSGAVLHLEMYVARLRQLRKIADEHAGKFRSDGLRALFATLHRELSDEYFDEISYHLKRLRFRAGVLISAGLDRDNSGINFVLRDPGDGRRPWTERLGIGPRSSYSFTLPPRDEAGADILSDLTSRGINLVANAAAQSADHIGSYFTMLRAELGFYVGCLNLADRLAAKGVPTAVPEPVKPSSLAFSCADLRDACLELQSPTRSWATTSRPTGSRSSSSPAPTRAANPRSCAASAWHSS